MTTRLARFTVLIAVLALGASSFIASPVGACGGSQTNGSCKEATPPAIDWTFGLRVIVSTLDALIP
jgi:hypothetical protein